MTRTGQGIAFELIKGFVTCIIYLAIITLQELFCLYCNVLFFNLFCFEVVIGGGTVLLRRCFVLFFVCAANSKFGITSGFGSFCY